MYIYVNIYRIYTPAGLAKSLARRPGAIVFSSRATLNTGLLQVLKTL